MSIVNDVWNQSVSICKSMVDIAASMVPGTGGGKVKEPVIKLPQAECTCAKKPLMDLTSGVVGMAPARTMIRLAGLSGATAVALGAYGAHMIINNDDIPDEQKHSYRTANLYHFVGTFGFVAAALGRRPLLTGSLMLVGVGFFSGACYIHGMTGNLRVKQMAPWGGTILILAWLSLIL